jgi:hypothetical protein
LEFAEPRIQESVAGRSVAYHDTSLVEIACAVCLVWDQNILIVPDEQIPRIEVEHQWTYEHVRLHEDHRTVVV